MNQVGFYQGRHYTTYVDDVQTLMRHGELAQAEQVLLALLDVIEAERAALTLPAVPWYYKRLAHIYRLQGAVDAEVAVIERYNRQPQRRVQACFEERLAETGLFANA